MNLAERNLNGAVRRLVSSVERTRRAVIVNLGDFFHVDNMQNKTMRSGNVLDVDTRWPKILRVGVHAMRTCIETALMKHESVKVINEIGNYDDHTAHMLTLALGMLYENNPRVTFDTSPARFHYLRFGKVLIGVTHGDNVKPEQLGPIMASDRAEDWGATIKRYWYTGHIHTRRVFEYPGCLVETFRTLAARDEWASSKGYRSGRDMCAIVIDEEYGEVERHTVDVREVEATFS